METSQPTEFVQQKVKCSKSVSQQMIEQRRSLSLRGLISLKGEDVNDFSIETIGEQKALLCLKLGKDTKVSTFAHLPLQQNLKDIRANHTMLTSYKGLSRLKNLANFEIEETPMSQRPNYRIALILAFGPRIRTINKVEITSQERLKASKYPSICKTFIDNDWDPTDNPPNENEAKELMQKYAPEIAKAVKKHVIKKEEIEAELSPRKTISSVKARPKPVKYNKNAFDEQLVQELIEKFKKLGIEVKNDEKVQENLLKVLKELSAIALEVSNEVDVGMEDATGAELLSSILNSPQEAKTESKVDFGDDLNIDDVVSEIKDN
ncbi:hypothetical protein TVAG_150190 [Trichomonas vaginalis G3]|uniref:Uncharacterized protein n=1 Tax=Trichomonas vaginalis (strain ATCC PRA-98 / G3) TaxID=412133 RepID=A2DRS1_TRIV3|nr:ribonuclease inhibitor domain-containing protein [Trichomonas vaginalis G3]EAY16868.1 hypothetical protein TVAG_150190 [Trichomonas vaginalis G3]KAI5489145.1 ribonuclease inhibitor domain-containing protein [Trichomonas vaginalis G3]|eukprot:XP_001329091.1 hypothetical protein [Trichomonas vaginalis G3]